MKKPKKLKYWAQWEFSNDDTTSERGNKAMLLLKRELGKGVFPFISKSEPVEEVPATDIERQTKGIDLFLPDSAIGIEVKYDGPAKHTNRIFIQTKESNARKAY